MGNQKETALLRGSSASCLAPLIASFITAEALPPNPFQEVRYLFCRLLHVSQNASFGAPSSHQEMPAQNPGENSEGPIWKASIWPGTFHVAEAKGMRIFSKI